MTFQLNQIDQISDFDEAMEALEQDYIPHLIEEFIASPEGQAYLQHADLGEESIGDWIGNFVMFGYSYLNRTLVNLRKVDAEDILLALFPQKLALLDPDDAETIIPELIAFWQFLQRQFKPRNGKKILGFLQKIQPRFKAIMNDPSNFGITKSFIMAGREAGFDMTKQEDLEAFQQIYNQRLRETGAPPPGFPALPAPMQGMGQNPLAAYPIPDGVPPEFVALLSQQMGLGAVPGLEHLPTDQDQLIAAIAQHLVDSGDVQISGDPDVDSPEGLEFFENINVSMLRGISDALSLSDEAIALLTQQTVSETTPGSIVKDFETVLNAMGDRGLPVSGKLNHFSAKVVTMLNAQLSQPIQSDLKRPVQKSFSNVHGLYLLLRATGMTEVVAEGKQQYLTLNPEGFASWQTLTPTEKYFTLLEAWIIRGDAQMLGEQRNPLAEGTRVLKTWQQTFQKTQTYKDYNAQTDLNYWPGLHNIALLQLFGWISLTSPKPDPGKGWRIKQVKPLPFGNAIAALLMQAYVQQEFQWTSQDNFSSPWGELQPYVVPYFPEWQNNLASPNTAEFQLGTYIFNVSLGKIWRRISISSEDTLATLADLILESVDFDSDHLDMFSFRDRTGRQYEIHNPLNEWRDGSSTDEVRIGDLPLQVGNSMTYLFDFGDNWEFNVMLEQIQPGQPARSNKILDRHGKAPEQYPDWS